MLRILQLIYVFFNSQAKVEVMLFKWALADSLKLQVVTNNLLSSSSSAAAGGGGGGGGGGSTASLR